MRLIGHLESEDEVQRIAHFLQKKGIETSFDGFFDANTGHMSYQLWAFEEDQIIEAQKEFQDFLKDPLNPVYDLPLSSVPPPREEAHAGEEKESPETSFTPFTTFIIALCGFIFLLNFAEEVLAKKNEEKSPSFFLTAVQLGLFYDVPEPIERLKNIIEKQEIKSDQKREELPPGVVGEIQATEQMSFWHGAYTLLLLQLKGGDPDLANGEMFRKISKGEVWRLFSPAILHVGFIHLLFNMIWAWILSRPIERKIGAFRLAILILFIGIGSNTAQYLMSGPFFLGYSGVIMGLAGFTWVRERRAPWEGYPLRKSTFWFLVIYVCAMVAIQIASFLMQLALGSGFSSNIANTAHIMGGLIGMFLGRFSYFAERVRY